MRRTAVFILAACYLAAVLQAETYVRGVHHIPGGYRYAREVPTLDIVYEWWFDSDKAVLSSTGWRYDYGGNTDWRVVWDRGLGRIIVANLTARTYLEFSMVADPKEFVDDGGLRYLPQFKIYGTAASTGRQVRVLGRSCREFEVAEWQVRNDEDRFYDRRRKVLASPDVAFNWRLADQLLQWISKLFNLQKEYVADLRKINGFILASEEEASEGGSVISWNYRVTEIRSDQAPKGIFDPPEGFKRIEKLNVGALYNLRGIVHIYPLY